MAKQNISIRKLVDKVTDGELTLPETQWRIGQVKERGSR